MRKLRVHVKCSPDHARKLALRAQNLGDFETAAALEILARDVEGYTRSLVAHHAIHNLSEDAIRESIGGPCQICANANREHD